MQGSFSFCVYQYKLQMWPCQATILADEWGERERESLSRRIRVKTPYPRCWSDQKNKKKKQTYIVVSHSAMCF